jgi:hypothetical protein
VAKLRPLVNGRRVVSESLLMQPTRLPLQSFRPEFAVADAGANFHLRADCCDCVDDFFGVGLYRRDQDQDAVLQRIKTGASYLS